MKFETIINILFDLLAKRTVNATYLSQKYGVCVRTIYRYVETLEGAGVPLYTIRGKNGGFRIMDTYRLPATFMTAVSLTYILTAKEGLQLGQTLSCILGATAAAVLLAIYAVILFCRLRKPEYRSYTKES